MPLVNCPDCGQPVAHDAPACPHCGRPHPGGSAAHAPHGAHGGEAGAGGGFASAPPPFPPPAQNVPNYLVQAILVTLCCCLPFGIVSIVYAAQVNSKRDQGDIAGAWEASKKAKMWAWVAFGMGLLANVIFLAFGLLGAVMESAGM